MELPVKAPNSGGLNNTSYKLEIKNLSYKLRGSKLDQLGWFCFVSDVNKSPKYILKNVNCEVMPGELSAIAGPSGAGKTTLLEILAGKISPGEFSGQVLVNNRPIHSKSFRRLSGFVTQDDALFPLLTVQETIMYSALLRLPRAKKVAAANRVRRVMKDLDLDQVANSRIGEGSNRGISGGERRRVSIGADLVHDPAVVLLDEPTSGLDSASAVHVVTLLKSMVVKQGKTILLTIHQPGFRILQLFNRLVLLSNGTVMHNGSLHSLEERIKLAGYGIPRSVNVLEFAIEVMGGLEIQSSGPLSNFQVTQSVHNNTIRVSQSNTHQEKPLNYPNSVYEEVLVLGQRFCSNIFRTRQLFSTRIIQALVAGLVLGTIFFKVGNETGQNALQTRIGFFAFSLTFLLSSTTEVLPIFLQERRILMRETSRGAYRVLSYVISNMLVFIPFLLMVSLLYSTPVYWLVGLRQNLDGYIYFSLVVWLVVLMSNSFVSCFSALVPNFIMGTSVIAGLIGSFFLFSGYFISKDDIPSYWIFMHYLSLFKYPFECFLLNEYGGDQGNKRCIVYSDNGQCCLNGSEFLRQQKLQESEKWSNLAIMFAFIVGYRVFCYLILWFRCFRNR